LGPVKLAEVNTRERRDGKRSHGKLRREGKTERKKRLRVRSNGPLFGKEASERKERRRQPVLAANKQRRKKELRRPKRVVRRNHNKSTTVE